MDTKADDTHVRAASVKVWLIRSYHGDLTEFYAGDEGRFNRMIIDQGKSAPTANPHGWAQHIVNCTPTKPLSPTGPN